MDDRRTYNFVMCPSYHGATVLACLLSNHSRTTALGDLLPIKKLLDRAMCGCGAFLRDCEFWRELGTRVDETSEYRDGSLLPLYPVVLRNEARNRWLMRAVAFAALHTTHRVWRLFARQSREYVGKFRALYDAACDLQGTSCFVDGQKNMAKVSIFMGLMGTKRVKVLHLFRDPRAVYYSYLRHDRAADAASFARRWQTSHRRILRLTGRLGPSGSLRVRHEDLCDDPASQLDAIQDFLGLERETLLRPSTRGESKHVIGNKMTATFDGTVRNDTRWRDAVSADDQKTIVREAAPLFGELGYVE